MNKQRVQELFGKRHVNFKLRVYQQLESEFLTSERICEKVNVGRCYRDCLAKDRVDSFLRIWAGTPYVEKSSTLVRHLVGGRNFTPYRVRTYRRATK
jgi:hypothetical protein